MYAEVVRTVAMTVLNIYLIGLASTAGLIIGWFIFGRIAKKRIDMISDDYDNGLSPNVDGEGFGAVVLFTALWPIFIWPMLWGMFEIIRELVWLHQDLRTGTYGYGEEG